VSEVTGQSEGYIVVVDDSLTVRMMLKAHLEGAGYRVDVFADGESACESLRTARPLPDLVLLDVIMPGMDGMAVLSFIKTTLGAGFVPVIFLTAQGEVRDRVQGLNLGADDYIAKPFEADELLARVRAHIRIKRLQDALAEHNTALVEANQEKATLLGALEAKNAQLAEMANTDPLTGVANRGYIEVCLANEVARATRFGTTLSVGMVDIDHFKRVNDSFGHPFGDRVIREVARVLSETVRQVDMVGRYGGEEFLVVMPGTGLDGAGVLAERIRAAVAALVHQPEAHSATLSVGVAQWERDAGTWEGLVSRADQALYQAKEEGRNRVCRWTGGRGVPA
jgi:diguanylate cyclase (GGDEF)-like protein